MSGDLYKYFFFENYFNLQNPFFVIYTDIPKFHVISPTALMMKDLHLSSHMTKKGSCDVKYFLQKNCQKESFYNLQSEMELKKIKFSHQIIKKKIWQKT